MTLSLLQLAAYLHEPIWPNASSADSHSSASWLSNNLSLSSIDEITVLTPKIQRQEYSETTYGINNNNMLL